MINDIVIIVMMLLWLSLTELILRIVINGKVSIIVCLIIIKDKRIRVEILIIDASIVIEAINFIASPRSC